MYTFVKPSAETREQQAGYGTHGLNRRVRAPSLTVVRKSYGPSTVKAPANASSASFQSAVAPPLFVNTRRHGSAHLKNFAV